MFSHTCKCLSSGPFSCPDQTLDGTGDGEMTGQWNGWLDEQVGLGEREPVVPRVESPAARTRGLAAKGA